MRKLLPLLSAIFLVAFAIVLVNCGNDSHPTPVTQTNSVAFMQEVAGSPFLFTPSLGTFSTTGTTTTFTTSTIKDPGTGQAVKADFYSIMLSADGKKGTLDLYGGMEGDSGQWDIWVANADGTGTAVQITNDDTNNSVPQFSPDGTKVVFTALRPGTDSYIHYSTVIRKADGTDTSATEKVLPLPAGTEDTWAPTYSPDGSKIAVEIWGYDSSNNWFDGIWIMNADGTNQQMLTNPWAQGCDCYDETPSFTPDGTKITFSRDEWTGETEVENIYIMNVDGSNVTKLTDSSVAVNNDPIVVKIANVGTKILFSSNRDNVSAPGGTGFELYSMNIDGTNVTRLTSNALFDGFNGEWYEPGENSSVSARQSLRAGMRHPALQRGQVQGVKVRW